MSGKPVAENRVLLVGMTGVLADVVRSALSGWPDIELLDGAGTATPTAVVCGACSPAEVRELLYEFPRVRVLTVEDDGRRGFVHQLVPQSAALGELSPERLVTAIRAGR